MRLRKLGSFVWRNDSKASTRRPTGSSRCWRLKPSKDLVEDRVETRSLFFEQVEPPFLRLVDDEAAARLAEEHGVRAVQFPLRPLCPFRATTRTVGDLIANVRRPRHLLVAILAAFAVSVAAQPGLAADPAGLTAYLAKVKPLAAAYTQQEKLGLSAIRHNQHGKLRVTGVSLVAISDKLLKVVPSGALREPHGSLVRGVRIYGKATIRYADDVQRAGSTQLAVDKFSASLDIVETLTGHWQDETIVQLRQAGLPVPLWLKTFG